jgi:hypothetical protein
MRGGGFMMIGMVVGISVALIVGWLAGMLTHRRAERWCPADGSRLTCVQCQRAGVHQLGDIRHSPSIERRS